MSGLCRSSFACIGLALAASQAGAADWYVAPGPPTGDGSAAKPFNDPWRALAVANSGDTIHIAEGVYTGRYDRSYWEIDRPRITILGGYDRAFTKRDPWKQPSVFAFYTDYEGTTEGNLLNGRDDHSGVVLDGLAFDGGGRNRYDPKPPMGIRGGLTQVGPLLSLSSPDVVVRNCLFVNSLSGAVELSGEGSRFENNIVANHRGVAMLVIRGRPDAKVPVVARGNTFAFAFDDSDPPMGNGGEKGIAIRVTVPAQIENNVFIAAGNAAVLTFGKPDKIALDRNVFRLSMRANVAVKEAARESLIADKNLEELEDLGFKSVAGNRAADVGPAGLKPEWIDGVTRHLLLAYAKPPKEAIAELRKAYGLGEPGKPAPNDIGPSAPYLAPAEAGALRVTGDAGARPVELKVNPPAAAPATPAPKYARIEWGELTTGAPALEGRAVEVRVAVGHERHGFVLDGITQEKYLGFDVLHPGGERFPDQIHVFALRNGTAHRQWQEAVKSTNAREAEDWYLLRGTVRLAKRLQKATMQVDSIVPAEAPPAKPIERPKGRDWYVKAGAAGGDGSREKPFRDPFLPLEKAAAGDNIHVAGGDYFGKLRQASWKVGVKHLRLLGGYDADFKTRDPWKNPTRLVMTDQADPKEKKQHSGEFLEAAEIVDGFVLDGFVFDGSTINAYFDPGAAAGGALNIRGSPMAAMIKLIGADIAVRNCVFVNANGMGADITGADGVFENNVIVNTSGTALSIKATGRGPWIVRRNTLLFAMDPTPRAGTGLSTGFGSLMLFRGRGSARVEDNIFAFADNYGVRATAPRAKLMLDGNAFGANLYCHFTDADRVWLFDAVWDRRLADAGLFSGKDNVTGLPAGLPVDKQYADRVLPRLFDIKGKYKREDWVRTAAAVGAGVAPAPDPAEPKVVEKPKEDKPKTASLDDLAAELDKLKAESNKPVEAPKGPPFAPAYPWRKALELARDPAAAPVGARRAI